MAKVQTQEEANRLNREDEYGPYQAANGHIMIAPLRYPRDPSSPSGEREYRIGDEIQYESWCAWCAPGCNHQELGPLEDW